MSRALLLIAASTLWVGGHFCFLRGPWRAWSEGAPIGPGVWIEIAAGLPMLVWAILLWRGRDFVFSKRDRLAFVIGAVVVRTILIDLPPAQSEHPTADLYRYLWEGRVQLDGNNPFLHPPDSPALEHLRDTNFERINHREHSAIYPPLAQWVFLAVAAIRPTPTAMKIAFTLFDLGVLLVLMTWLRRLGRSEAWAALWAFHPLVIAEFSGNGHLDSLMIFLTVLALERLDAGRERGAVFALAGAVAAKLIPLALAPYFIWRMRRPWLLALVPALLAFSYLPYAGAGAIGPIGRLTAPPIYNPQTGQTTLSDWTESFKPGALAGRLITLDGEIAQHATIVDNDRTTILIVVGDGALNEGDRYEVAGGIARSLWVYQRDWIYNAPIFSFARDRLFGGDGWRARWGFYVALAALAIALWARRVEPAAAALPVLGFYQVAGPVVHPWYLALFVALACVRRGGWPWLWSALAAPLVYWRVNDPAIVALVWGPFPVGLGVAAIGAIRERRKAIRALE